MVNVLIGNKNSTELDILSHRLANDKNYSVENNTSGKDTINNYFKMNSDILILDNSLTDLSIEDIVNRLSINPYEQKKCNIILTLPHDYNIKLRKYVKISDIVYKPFIDNSIDNAIMELSTIYNTPNLDFGEVDWLLQSLNFNCFSSGYKYIKDAITYCYYKPYELESLNNILEYLAYSHNTTAIQVRDSMNGCIRPFNNSTEYNCPDELLKRLYNNGYKLSLKDFLQRFVLYLIQSKKRK